MLICIFSSLSILPIESLLCPLHYHESNLVCASLVAFSYAIHIHIYFCLCIYFH
jgi:hypothetical protein